MLHERNLCDFIRMLTLMHLRTVRKSAFWKSWKRLTFLSSFHVDFNIVYTWKEYCTKGPGASGLPSVTSSVYLIFSWWKAFYKWKQIYPIMRGKPDGDKKTPKRHKMKPKRHKMTLKLCQNRRPKNHIFCDLRASFLLFHCDKDDSYMY